VPYLFAIVGDPELSGEMVGERIDDGPVKATALFARSTRALGKRDLEDLVVAHLAESGSPAYSEARARIERADWYVLSARKAHMLLRE
jgi:hypothetical protein